MLGTILAFTYIAWLGLDRFGIPLDRTSATGCVRRSVVAALLGVTSSTCHLMPTTWISWRR